MPLSSNPLLMGTAATIFLVLTVPAHSQDRAAASPVAQANAPEVASCPGSAPEPGQSAPWSVAFCNRTGHDVVLEFHDNDCPAKDWSHRGDVYQRMLHKGESKTFPLCYANEAVGRKLAPGVPTLRIPGGKGVVTTWSVVGDCGERSRPLNLDARSFYDRGEYRSGIVLLQYPAGASHCAPDGASAAGGPIGGGPNSGAIAGTTGAPYGSTAGAASGSTVGTGPGPTAGAAPGPTAGAAPGPNAGAASGPNAGAASGPNAGAASGSTAGAAPGPNSSAASGPNAGAASGSAAGGAPGSTSHAGQPTSAVAPHSPVAAAAAAAINNRGSGTPTLTAAVDQNDKVGRTVRVFANEGAGYKCTFNLALTFTDGGSWNDHGNADITPGDANAPIATRKYLKSVSKVQITSSKCTP